MPTVHHTGVSRKIISAENRSRLRRLVSEPARPIPAGFIVRTAAARHRRRNPHHIEFLGQDLERNQERSEQRKAPALPIATSTSSSASYAITSRDFTGIWIDNEEEYGKIVEFVSRFQPKLVNKVSSIHKETPIFEECRLQLTSSDKACAHKVWSSGATSSQYTSARSDRRQHGQIVAKGFHGPRDPIVKDNS